MPQWRYVALIFQYRLHDGTRYARVLISLTFLILAGLPRQRRQAENNLRQLFLVNGDIVPHQRRGTLQATLFQRA